MINRLENKKIHCDQDSQADEIGAKSSDKNTFIIHVLALIGDTPKGDCLRRKGNPANLLDFVTDKID